jgi:hypothetical protein
MSRIRHIAREHLGSARLCGYLADEFDYDAILRYVLIGRSTWYNPDFPRCGACADVLYAENPQLLLKELKKAVL